MITIRRANERHHAMHGKQEIWHTFHEDCSANQCAEGFAALEVLNEELVPPGIVTRRLSRHNAQMLTCVHEGSLAFEDPTGNSGVIQAGEVQCRTTLRGMQRSETNGSQTTWVHVYQFGLRVLAEGLQPTLETKRFSAADRRGALRLVASPDARGGSLLIQFDALLFSAILDPGKHVVHELSPGRGAWFHVVRGRISSNTEELFAGDGVGVRGERSVSLTAEDESEILLLDLRQSPADTFRGEQEGEFTSAQ